MLPANVLQALILVLLGLQVSGMLGVLMCSGLPWQSFIGVGCSKCYDAKEKCTGASVDRKQM